MILLLKRDRRRDVFNRIEIRLGHFFKKLPRVRGQALHVAPLALGIEGVENERAFTAPGQTRDYRQFPSWKFDRDVLEIVLSDLGESYGS